MLVAGIDALGRQSRVARYAPRGSVRATLAVTEMLCRRVRALPGAARSLMVSRVRRFAIPAALVLALFGALAIRVVIEGRSALATGDEALAAGKPAAAIAAFETSARWYLPLAPHVGDAYARLRELSASSDPAVAIAAARAIRSAALATRTLWQPHGDDLASANALIAKLSANNPEGAPVENDSPAAREAWHRARLARATRPSIGAALLAGLGILLWIGGAALVARRGITETGGLARRPALAGALAIVVGLVCWFAGLYNA